jgi:hypothetical protein
MLNEKLEAMLNKMVGKVVSVGIVGLLSKYYEIENFAWWLNQTYYGHEYLEIHKEMDWDMLSISLTDIKDVLFEKNNKEVTIVINDDLRVSLWINQ